MTLLSRRSTLLLGCAALAAQSGIACGQDLKVPNVKDLIEIFSDERRLNLFKLDIDFLRLTLLRIQFDTLKVKSFSELSAYSVSKSFEKDRDDYLKQRRYLDDPKLVQDVILKALQSGTANNIVETVGKLCLDSAKQIAAALSEYGIRNKLNIEPVFSLVAFGQTVAVANQKADSSPPYCNYFPFSRYCKTT